MNISGKIYADDNELSSDDLSFALIVTRDKECFSFIGTCWLDPSMCVPFAFDYEKRKDTVIYKGKFRLCFCSYELYNKYYLNVQYNPNINNHFLCLPWIKVGDTNTGIAVPQLVECIFSRLPHQIVFEMA